MGKGDKFLEIVRNTFDGNAANVTTQVLKKTGGGLSEGIIKLVEKSGKYYEHDGIIKGVIGTVGTEIGLAISALGIKQLLNHKKRREELIAEAEKLAAEIEESTSPEVIDRYEEIIQELNDY